MWHPTPCLQAIALPQILAIYNSDSLSILCQSPQSSRQPIDLAKVYEAQPIWLDQCPASLLRSHLCFQLSGVCLDAEELKFNGEEKALTSFPSSPHHLPAHTLGRYLTLPPTPPPQLALGTELCLRTFLVTWLSNYSFAPTLNFLTATIPLQFCPLQPCPLICDGVGQMTVPKKISLRPTLQKYDCNLIWRGKLFHI